MSMTLRCASLVELALLVACVGAVRQMVAPAPAAPHILLVGQDQRRAQSTQLRVAAEVSVLVDELWSDLVIRNTTNASTNASIPADFNASDKAAKDAFVADCVQRLDVHEVAIPMVDDVVDGMCVKVGGTATECKNMTGELWKAHNSSELEPWCKTTFNFFAEKTKPKCLKKCRALICEDRCSVQDQYKDLRDQEAAYSFKLNQTLTRAAELSKLNHNDTSEIDEFNKTNVTGPAKKVAELEKVHTMIGDSLGNLTLDASNASKTKDTAFAALTEARAGNVSKEEVSKLEAAYEKASTDFDEAQTKKTSMGTREKAIAGLLAKAQVEYDFRLKRLNEMVKEHDAKAKKVDDQISELAAKKTSMETSLTDLRNRKKQLCTRMAAGGTQCPEE